MIPQALQRQLAADQRLTLTVKVIPKSSRNEVVEVLAAGYLKVKVTAAPDKGKANAAVCDVLAAAFEVSRRNVRIVRGETSHTKQVEIFA